MYSLPLCCIRQRPMKSPGFLILCLLPSAFCSRCLAWAEAVFCPALPPFSPSPPPLLFLSILPHLLLPLLPSPHQLPEVDLEALLSSGLNSSTPFLDISLEPWNFLESHMRKPVETISHLFQNPPLSPTWVLWVMSSAATPYSLLFWNFYPLVY